MVGPSYQSKLIPSPDMRLEVNYKLQTISAMDRDLFKKIINCTHQFNFPNKNNILIPVT